MSPANLDAGSLARNQRASDANVLFFAEQVLGVEHAKREAHHGRDRRQGNVALGEVELQTDDLATLEDTAADHAGVRDRRGIRAGARPGQREAGNLQTLRQTRQVVVLLLVGAIVNQQLSWPE